MADIDRTELDFSHGITDQQLMKLMELGTEGLVVRRKGSGFSLGGMKGQVEVSAFCRDAAQFHAALAGLHRLGFPGTFEYHLSDGEEKPGNWDEETLPPDVIVVGDRYRKDLGDLDALADSIERLGMLEPVVITRHWHLVAGQRRLTAALMRKRPWVPVRTVAGLDDALAALRAEHDENICRKDFTPSEAVAIGKALEELEKPRARKRQEATQAKKGAKVGAAQGGGKFPPPSGGHGKTADKVGAAVGMSGKTYRKAKAVVEAAAEPDAKPEVKEAAAEMDRTGKVDRAYKKVRGGRGDGGKQREKPRRCQESTLGEKEPEEEFNLNAELSPIFTKLTSLVERLDVHGLEDLVGQLKAYANNIEGSLRRRKERR
jgi:ParB family chromosome partitioning protein